MKKTLKQIAFSALAGFAMYACKPADEVIPNADKPNVTIKFSSAEYGVQGSFVKSATVSTTGDSAYINLEVDGDKETSAIYVLYQQDDNKAVKFTKQPNGSAISEIKGTDLTGANSTKFNYKGGDYTFDVANNLNKKFKLTIPILLRNTATAKSDVFTIWITKKGENGRFDNPAKALAYGVATVTLNYTNSNLINYYETELGSSKNLEIGSLFSTKFGSNYTRAFAQDTLMGNGIDFVYNNFTDDKFVFGSFYKDATNTNADVTAGFKQNPGGVDKIKNVIKIAKSTSADWTSATDEAKLKEAAMKTVSATSPSFVSYSTEPTSEILSFITSDGKYGLIKVVTSNSKNTTSGSVNLEVKVQR